MSYTPTSCNFLSLPLLQSVRSLRSVLTAAPQGFPVTLDQLAWLKTVLVGGHHTPAAGSVFKAGGQSGDASGGRGCRKGCMILPAALILLTGWQTTSSATSLRGLVGELLRFWSEVWPQSEDSGCLWSLHVRTLRFLRFPFMWSHQKLH